METVLWKTAEYLAKFMYLEFGKMEEFTDWTSKNMMSQLGAKGLLSESAIREVLFKGLKEMGM